MARSKPRNRATLRQPCPRHLLGRRRSGHRRVHHSRLPPHRVRSRINRIRHTSSSLPQTQDTMAHHTLISRPSLQASSRSSPVHNRATLVLIPSRRASNIILNPYSPTDPMECHSMARQAALRNSLPTNAFPNRHQDRSLRVCTHHNRRATFHILHRRSIHSSSASHHHLRQALCCPPFKFHLKIRRAFTIPRLRHHSTPRSLHRSASGRLLSSSITKRLAPIDLAHTQCIRTWLKRDNRSQHLSTTARHRVPLAHHSPRRAIGSKTCLARMEVRLKCRVLKWSPLTMYRQ